MSKRAMLVIGAVAAAAVVLLVTLVAGPEAPQQQERVESLGAIRAPEAMQGLDADPVEDAEFGASTAVGGTEHGSYSFRNGDRFTVLTWDEITPKPDDVSDIVKPVMRDYLSPRRVVQLTADEGTVVAPEHHPRRGQLRKNVVLTLYESSDGKPADLEGVGDIQMRVFLDEATFDVELGQVDSFGPVRLTGPTVDFKGQGLSLNYNQLRQRLERLEIARGDWLRFKATQARATPQREAEAEHAGAPEPRVETGGATSADVSEPGADSAAPTADASASEPQPEPADPPQFYRARFFNDVKVVAGDPATDDRVTMLGDTLIATFGFAKDDDTATTEPSPPGEPASAAVPDAPPPPDAPGPAAARPEAPPAATAEPDTAPTAPTIDTPADSLMAYSPDDVVITWSGRLVVQPEPEAADELAGPDDVLLAIEGGREPVHVTTAGGDTLTAARADYLASARRLRADASDDAPLRIDSSDMGTLAGTHLELNQAARTGHVRGPGYLKAPITRVQQGGSTPVDPSPDTPDSPHTPEVLEVAWVDHLDMTFYEPTDDADGSGQFGDLRTAVFHGDVNAIHPQFQLTGRDTVTVDLTQATEEVPSTINRIRAAGDAALFARADDGSDEIHLDGQRLDIRFAPGPDGQPYPATLEAYEQVTVRQPNLTLHTNELHAQAEPASGGGGSTSADMSDPDSESEPEPDSPRLTITALNASGGVDVETRDPALKLRGDRLVLDDGADHIEIFGAPGSTDSLARVDLPEGTLFGEHLIIHQQAQTLDVPTAGILDLDTLPGDQEGELRIAWDRSMHFDNAGGFAEFIGDIVATTDTPTDRTRLTADSLDLEFEPEPHDDGTPTESGDAPTSTQRIRRAFARGDAVFTAESFEPTDADEPDVQTLLRLRGPVMTFDNRENVEIVHVIGAGDMVIQDNRPAEPASPGAAGVSSPPRNAGTSSPSPAVNVSGRGDTLFQWTRQLTLDAGENTMTMTGRVRMTHQPPSGEPIFFDAARLTADLTDSEGLATLSRARRPEAAPASAGPSTETHDDSPALEITRIEADDNITIVQGGRTVTCQHLRYDEARRIVTLTANPGGLVRVTDEEQRIPITGGKVRWDLAADRFIIDQPGPITVPRER